MSTYQALLKLQLRLMSKQKRLLHATLTMDQMISFVQTGAPTFQIVRDIIQTVNELLVLFPKLMLWKKGESVTQVGPGAEE